MSGAAPVFFRISCGCCGVGALVQRSLQFTSKLSGNRRGLVLDILTLLGGSGFSSGQVKIRNTSLDEDRLRLKSNQIFAGNLWRVQKIPSSPPSHHSPIHVPRRNTCSQECQRQGAFVEPTKRYPPQAVGHSTDSSICESNVATSIS